MVHDMTPAQASIFREVVSQHLGVPPSAYWGKQKIWFKLPNTDRKTLIYLLESLNHAPHITSLKLSRNKKAGSLLSAAGEALSDGAKAGKQFIKNGAEFVAEHGTQILHGVDTVLNVASQADQTARKLGLLDDDSDLSKASDFYQQVRGLWDDGSGFTRPKGRTRRRKLGKLL